MIIELFGPPGAGKTTLAHALTRRLHESGHIVELMLSYRPAEHRSSPAPRPSSLTGRQLAAVRRRLSRPLLEMLAIGCHPFAMSHAIGTATVLMKLLPPRTMAVGMRLSQYILRLSHSWCRASAAGHIVLFDQGFMQLVCSLALLSRLTDNSLIARALDAVPRPDVLIRLDAPPETLAARLNDRQRRQSGIERLFEPDLETHLKSVGIIDELYRLLLCRGQSVICASSLDQQSLSESIEAIEDALAARFRAAREAAARPKQHATSSIGKVAI
jgi:thymidylate kinase